MEEDAPKISGQAIAGLVVLAAIGVVVLLLYRADQEKLALRAAADQQANAERAQVEARAAEEAAERGRLQEEETARLSEQFGPRVLEAADARNGRWMRLRVDEFAPRQVRLTLLYSSDPASMAEVERDTRSIVRGALSVLQAEGKTPTKDIIFVFAHAHKPERGVTGSDQVRVYGKAFYDPFSDSIKFQAAK